MVLDTYSVNLQAKLEGTVINKGREERKSRKSIDHILPAQFAHILQNCVACQGFGRICFLVFSCFYIEIAYSNFTYCGPYTLSFLAHPTG